MMMVPPTQVKLTSRVTDGCFYCQSCNKCLCLINYNKHPVKQMKLCKLLSITFLIEFPILEEMTVQVTNEEQHILWEEYGLRLHIPHDVLPDDCKLCNLKIAVSVSENFQLPEDCFPVSAVYSFTHNLGDRKLRKPVTLEIQHCATSIAWSGLQILRANDNSKKFKVVPGGIFLPDDHYGKMKLDYFSTYLFAFFWKLFSLFYRNEPHPSPPPTVPPQPHPSSPPTVFPQPHPSSSATVPPSATVLPQPLPSSSAALSPQPHLSSSATGSPQPHPSSPPAVSPQPHPLSSVIGSPQPHPSSSAAVSPQPHLSPTIGSPQPHPSSSATVSPREYHAQLYYTDIASLTFKSNLYILPNLNANFKVCIKCKCINFEPVHFFFLLIGNREGDEGGI